MNARITRREALRRVSLLVGGTLSASTVAGILGGCRAGSDGATGYAFEALDPEQRELTATLVDLILPATETPGAREAGVPEFIDRMLVGYYDDDERARFYAGLNDVDARAQHAHSARFADLDAAQQSALLAALAQEAYPAAASAAAAPADSSGADGMDEEAATEGYVLHEERQPDDSLTSVPASPPAAPPFFKMIKELTLSGYYTSEIGATQELQWLAAPGRYDGDVPVTDRTRAWA